MNRKSMVVAMLFGVVALSLVFLPIASQSGTYDPWADYNEDGIIDIDDVMPAALGYGSSGDPTKNVTIVGHATKLIKAANGVVVPAWGSWASSWVTADGYSKVTINIYFETNTNYYYLFTKTSGGVNFVADRVTNFNYDLVKTYDVMNQQIDVTIINNSGSSATLYIDIYLMA